MKAITLIMAGCLLLTACGTAGGAASAGGDTKPTLTITAPKDGATVGSSFKLEFTSSVEIGPTDSGKDHAHVFTDGQTNDYTVVTASPFEMKGLPAGKHTVGVTLQKADHSPAGASAQITVNVTGGGSTPQDTATPEDTSGYGGGY